MRRTILALILSAMLVIGIAGPSSAASLPAASARISAQQTITASAITLPAVRTASHPAFFDKTRFLGHMGLALYVFHHFVYARYKSGGFASGASGRTGNFVKAALALAFTYHELKVSYDIANKSNSSVLHAVVSPLNALLGKVSNVHDQLKGNNLNPSALDDLNNSTSSLTSTAKSNGLGINEVSPPSAVTSAFQ